MSSKKDKKAAKKLKLEEDQPEVDPPDTPGPSLDRSIITPTMIIPLRIIHRSVQIQLERRILTRKNEIENQRKWSYSRQLIR